MTVIYELDPINGTVVLGILNGLAQASGFVTPLVSATFTTVEHTLPDYWQVREGRWRYFFLFNGVVGVLGVLSVGVALLWGTGEWVKHPSLSRNKDQETKTHLGLTPGKELQEPGQKNPRRRDSSHE